MQSSEDNPTSFYYALVKFGDHSTDILVFDSSFSLVSNKRYHEIVISKLSSTEFNDHVFAIDNQQGLYALNTHYLDKSIVPQKVLAFTEDGNENTVISMSERNIWLIHASGLVQTIKKDLFEGTRQLDNFVPNNYLAWKQHGNMFAAVNRFNVVSFWNTMTGKLVHRTRL